MFVDARKSLGVAPAPSGTATAKDGVATFPSTSGHVTVFKPGKVGPSMQGGLVHEGSGLAATQGDTAITLDNFLVDPGNPATLSGRVSAGGEVLTESTKVFDLDGSTLEPVTNQEDAGPAIVEGTTVNLTDGAAQAMNGAFKTGALNGGTKIGIATIVVKLPQMKDVPAGGVETGGGASGVESLGLLGAGVAAQVAADGVAFVARRRGHTRPPQLSTARGRNVAPGRLRSTRAERSAASNPSPARSLP